MVAVRFAGVDFVFVFVWECVNDFVNNLNRLRCLIMYLLILNGSIMAFIFFIVFIDYRN